MTPDAPICCDVCGTDEEVEFRQEGIPGYTGYREWYSCDACYDDERDPEPLTKGEWAADRAQDQMEAS